MTSAPLDLLLSLPALALLGLCVGSFINVVAHRLPLMMDRQLKLESADILGLPEPAHEPHFSLAHPASRCPSCGHRIRWYENIPLLSWLALRGKCSACSTSISARYPLVEVSCAALFAAIGAQHGPHPSALLWCGFAAMLLALTLIDWDTTLLPDDLTYPLLWAGLIAAVLGWTPIAINQAIWGAVAGYLSLWSVYWLFKLTTGKEGMGYGDFKLLAALGAWLGWQMLLPVVLTASLIGAVIGLAMKFSGSLREGIYVPFGPFLAGAGLAVMFAGSERVATWMGWY